MVHTNRTTWVALSLQTRKTENDSTRKILGLVDLRHFQGYELATWPHERPKP